MEDALDFCDNLDVREITNKRGETKPLEDNSKRRILNSVKSLYSFAYNLEQDPRNHAILHTLYAAGLRVSELCNLRWRHIIRREEGVQLDLLSYETHWAIVISP